MYIKVLSHSQEILNFPCLWSFLSKIICLSPIILSLLPLMLPIHTAGYKSCIPGVPPRETEGLPL